VTLTLVGLPADYFSPSLVVPFDKQDFEFPVAFPYGTPQGDLAGVKLVGASTNDLGQPIPSNNQLDVAVKVVPGGPPPALYAVFEDEPTVIALLTEGDGQAALETTDRYAGSAALRVTPAQKFRSKMPTLGLAIAENPGEGQYRYLRLDEHRPAAQCQRIVGTGAGRQWPRLPLPGRGRPARHGLPEGQ
jgi:hypothetical protein